MRATWIDRAESACIKLVRIYIGMAVVAVVAATIALPVAIVIAPTMPGWMTTAAIVPR